MLDKKILGRLERLAETAGEGFLERLSAEFVIDADAHVAALHIALASRDAESVARSAHTLTGSSANLGANEMARVCATPLYRYGGEEFLCIFPEQTIAQGSNAIHRMLGRVEHLGIPHAGTPLGVVTLSPVSPSSTSTSSDRRAKYSTKPTKRSTEPNNWAATE